MALNLPQMPFKLTPQDMGNFDLSKAINSGLQNYQQGVKSKYANEMQRADIFNKTIAPLANIAISPLGLAMAPEQQQQIQNYISQALGSFNPPQQHQGDGWLDRIKDSFGFGGHQGSPYQNQVAPTQHNYDQPTTEGDYGLLPGAGEGIQSGARYNATTPFHSSAVKPGVVYNNPKTGEVISSPTGETVSGAQNSIVNINNATPILKSLSEQAKPFLKQGGMLGLKMSQVGGELRKLGAPDYVTNLLGGTKLANQYAKFGSSQSKAVDKLMKIYALPSNIESQHTVEKIITPQPGEDEVGYPQRIHQELSDFASQKERNKQVLGSGISLSGKKDNGKEPYKTKGNPKGASIGMYKNGVLHFIPADKAADAEKNWGYTYE